MWIYIFHVNITTSMYGQNLHNYLILAKVTWCHRSRDDSVPHMGFPISAPLELNSTKPLSASVFEIFGSKYIWVTTLPVTTLTFWGHVRSSGMWPFDTPYSISYGCSIVTNSLSPAVFEILGPKHIGVTTLTFQGHVTSSITWRFDSPCGVSY